MKSSKLPLPVAVVGALTIGTPNISALGRPYNGEEWITIDPSSGRVTLYPIDGVQMSQNEDGTINLDTSIPNDTSKWDSQVSSVGSTQSYIYVGFHIKPVEGVYCITCLDIIPSATALCRTLFDFVGWGTLVEQLHLLGVKR